jgi:hypothetical protein
VTQADFQFLSEIFAEASFPVIPDHQSETNVPTPSLEMLQFGSLSEYDFDDFSNDMAQRELCQESNRTNHTV